MPENQEVVENNEAEVFNGGPNTPAESVEVPETKQSEPKVFDAEYVKALREEAARNRVEKQKEAAARAEVEAKLKEYEDAKLTAEERLTQEFEQTKANASHFQQLALESDLKYQIAVAAKDEKIADVRAAVKLADRELIETDGNGNITNISDVIAAMKSEYPSLFTAAAPSAPRTGATNPAKQTGSKKYTREDLGKMTPERRVELLQSGELNHLL